MRGIATLLRAKDMIKHLHHANRTRGPVPSRPKKQEYDNLSEGAEIYMEKVDPIVAFSKPPPIPPLFGPLVAVSFLEMLSSHDSNDD